MMQQEGIPPDVITFNSLLKAAAAAGLLEEARRLYADMLACRLRPTTFTYVGLFKAAANARAGDAAWLLQVGPGRRSRLQNALAAGLLAAGRAAVV